MSMSSKRTPNPRKAARAVLSLVLAAFGGAAQAESATMTVSAVIPSKNVCKFSGGTLALPFGTIDPATGSNINATATMGFTCNGSSPFATFGISAGDGLYSSGPSARRMQHQTLAGTFLPYSLTWTPTAATVPKGSAQVLTVTGTLQPSNFQSALPGNYQDTVVLTLTP
jgi:spore coat protein U-like protein